MKFKNTINFLTLILIVIITLSFLLFQKGIWNYLDTYWLNDIKNISNILKDTFFIWSNNTYFGFDNGLNSFFRIIISFYSYFIINIFGVEFSQFIYYGVYFILIYYFSINFYKKISNLNGETNIHIIGLLTAFNPLTIWLMNTSTGIYTVPAFFIILNSFFNFLFLNKVRILDILLILIGFSLLFTYGRLLLIFCILLITIFCILIKKFELKINFKKIISFSAPIIIFFSPFIFLYTHLKLVDFSYSKSLFNYFESNKNYITDFVSWLNINYTGFEKITFKFHETNLFQSNNILYNLIFFLIIWFIVFLFILKVKQKGNIKHNILLFSFIIFYGTQFLYYLPINIFKFLSYDFMFLAGNLYWGKFLIFFIFTFIVLEVYLFYYNTKYKKGLDISILIFIFLSILPTINFINNFKIQKIDYSSLPTHYSIGMGEMKNEIKGTLFFPENEVLLTNQPYPIKYNYTSNYPIFLDNKRLINDKQIYLKEHYAFYNNIINGALFNLKNIFIFKNLKINDYGIEWYNQDDLNYYGSKYIDTLKNNSNIYIKQDNENFAEFGLKDDNRYEYKIYSPAKIIPSEIDTFFDNKIDIYNKPLVVDNNSFQKLENIDNFQIPKENQNIQINVKESVLNPTKYYLKLSNLDTSKPFLLQLNQTFGMSWKIKWVDKEYFDEKPCIDTYKNYVITDNSICQYKSKFIEWEDIKLLNKPNVNTKNHFEGNFIGNAWLVDSEDIPNEMKGQKELYAVIIYEKQIYYSYTLILSLFTLSILILLTIIQESSDFFIRRKLINK